MGDADSVSEGKVWVVKDFKFQTKVLLHLSTMSIGLWGDDNQFSSRGVNGIDNLIQSIQLRYTIRSPKTSEEVDDE